MPIDVMATQERETRVLGVYDDSAGVKTFRLSVPADFDFRPGQWVMIQFPDRAEQAGAYTISTSPLERGYIEISLCKVGPLTERLFALKGGETLLLRGPLGKWTYDDDVRSAVLITDGTGLTPFRSFGRYVLDKKLHNDLTIIQSARSADLFFYEDDLKRFEQEGFKIFRKVGQMTMEDVERAVSDLSLHDFYLCGPKGLVETISAGLAAKGVPKERVHYEKWGDYKWA